MPKNNQEQAIEELAKNTTVVGLDDLIRLLNSPKRLGLLRFYSGFMTGVGATIGAAIIIVILGLAVRYLGGVPWIGDFLNQIKEATNIK